MVIATASDAPEIAGSAGAKPSDMRSPVSTSFMLSYMFAQYAAWMALMTPAAVTLAFKVSSIAGPQGKGMGLGRIMAFGAFVALVAAPIWGALSDRTSTRVGRRKPWILAGSALLLCGLMVVATAATLLQVGIGWLICQCGSNAAQASLNAIIADVVPDRQRGRMSAMLGISGPLAMATGAFITQFTVGNDIAMFLVPWLPGAIAIPLLFCLLKEPPMAVRKTTFQLRALPQLFWINPLRHPDFAWVFLSRFLIFLAASSSHTYKVYFLTDRIGIAPAEVAGYVFLITSIGAGLTVVLTPLSGWLSDRTGRVKPFVFLPALIMSLGLAIISMSNALAPFIVGMIMVGIGAGVFAAVDLALCVAVLPDRSDAAKDMGVIQVANSLPQSLAPALAPLFLSIGGGGNNYSAVYLAATVFGIIGALAILPVRKTR
jgi:MFS family permease